MNLSNEMKGGSLQNPTNQLKFYVKKKDVSNLDIGIFDIKIKIILKKVYMYSEISD